MNGTARECLSSFRSSPIFRGGDVGGTFLSVLHPHKGLKGAVEVCKGVYWQCDLTEAKEMVDSGKAKPESFKLFLVAFHSTSFVASHSAPFIASHPFYTLRIFPLFDLLSVRTRPFVCVCV